jgi:hypothetical protein
MGVVVGNVSIIASTVASNAEKVGESVLISSSVMLTAGVISALVGAGGARASVTFCALHATSRLRLSSARAVIAATTGTRRAVSIMSNRVPPQ